MRGSHQSRMPALLTRVPLPPQCVSVLQQERAGTPLYMVPLLACKGCLWGWTLLHLHGKPSRDHLALQQHAHGSPRLTGPFGHWCTQGALPEVPSLN
jgi:hypothetical protein